MGLAALLAVQGARAEPAPTASLTVTVTGIKSAKGVIRLVICPPHAGFPECKSGAVHTADLAIARGQASTHVEGLTPGTYAVAVFHDANGNGKLDTFVGIPREGYGFSRNPPFRPRAPRFDEAGMAIDGKMATTISLRYLL